MWPYFTHVYEIVCICACFHVWDLMTMMVSGELIQRTTVHIFPSKFDETWCVSRCPCPSVSCDKIRVQSSFLITRHSMLWNCEIGHVPNVSHRKVLVSSWVEITNYGSTGTCVEAARRSPVLIWMPIFARSAFEVGLYGKIGNLMSGK